MTQIKLLRHAKNIMVVAGIWHRPISKNHKIANIYCVYAYVVQFVNVTALFLMFTELLRLLEQNDFEEVTDCFKIFTACSLSSLKCFAVRYGYIPKLFNKMIRRERAILACDDQESNSIYKSFVTYVNKTALAVLLLSNGTAAIKVLSTIVLGVMVKSNENDADAKPTILLIYFPFDQNKHYVMALILHVCVMVQACVYYCMAQIIYISMVVFITAELKLLQVYFRKFDDYAKKSRPAIGEVDMIKIFVRQHQFIISFVDELNESLKSLLLIEFLLSSLLIASVVFRLITEQTITEISFGFCYLLMLIGQLFILAWHANEIKIESLAISDAVYESPWHEKSVEIRTILFMVIHRSQKPLTLTIGQFKPLTTQTVISVIHGAYSYVTLMTRQG